MSAHPVARKYALALLELGAEREITETLRQQLDGLARLFRDSKELRGAMLNPSVSLQERHDTVRAIAAKVGLNEIARNFCLLLLDNDRFKLLPAIAEVLGRLVDERSGTVRAQVSSATELGPLEVNRIKKALASATGKQVIVRTEVDPELLGGVVARVGSRVFDGSVRTHLRGLRDSILREV